MCGTCGCIYAGLQAEVNIHPEVCFRIIAAGNYCCRIIAVNSASAKVVEDMILINGANTS